MATRTKKAGKSMYQHPSTKSGTRSQNESVADIAHGHGTGLAMFVPATSISTVCCTNARK
jgi:hypothetical protein